ncbi:MAG: glycoside hydrolase family 3 protein, partial [Hymenobacter sp.]
LRADPWTQKTLATGLTPTQAAQATNALQRYAVEHTRLGIPLLLAEECPHGHMAIGTTVFPTAIGQGSTWDPALLQRMGAAIAAEARVQGAHVGYGPVLDLAREPRWSRVEETYGEDPVLTSRMGVALVRGFQGAGLPSGRAIAATLKHFAAYGVPEGGHNGGSLSTGLRELHQSYFPPFRAAVQAGAWSVMAAYNSVDGVPCSASAYLLTDVLRRQWHFQGFTVSDLGSISGLASTHHVAATHLAIAVGHARMQVQPARPQRSCQRQQLQRTRHLRPLLPLGVPQHRHRKAPHRSDHAGRPPVALQRQRLQRRAQVLARRQPHHVDPHRHPDRPFECSKAAIVRRPGRPASPPRQPTACPCLLS